MRGNERQAEADSTEHKRKYPRHLVRMYSVDREDNPFVDPDSHPND